MNIILEITIFICLCITSFCLGFLLGKISGIQVVSTSDKNSDNRSFISKKSTESNEETKNKILIDDRKFVVDIKTDGLEKKYNQLGEIKQSTENIDSSINKLKNLRGS